MSIEEQAMPAGSSIGEQIAELGQWFHNLHLPDGTQTSPNHPFGDFPSFKWQRVAGAVPRDLRGWSVLDIGCNAGFYSIEMGRRGAHVLGLDVEPMYLRQARWAARQFGLEQQLEFVEGDVYRLLNMRRQFDLVWFTGVFYHLRYPTLALDLVRSVTGRMMVFQSMTMPGESQRATPADLPMERREEMLGDYWPKMAFVEHRVENDASNWWVPNAMCVEALLRSSGFEVISRPEHEFYMCRPVDIPKESRRDLAQVRSARPLHS
jgi:tRNA (mo5U34)-methyltransferase